MATAAHSLPAKCQADICLHPIGTAGPSISTYIARIETLAKQSKLEHKVHDTGTFVEGPWTEVMNLLGKAHMEMHDNGVQRVHSDVRISTRTDKG